MSIANKAFDKLFGSTSERFIKSVGPTVAAINAFEADFEKLTPGQLKDKTVQLKNQITAGKTVDDILPEAFALVREASKRTIKMRHFDVQLIGGMAMHAGRIAEMKTGEGKTLVATLPLYLNALSGKGVHLVTVNDYLSRRDCGWMAPVYDALGLTVGVIVHDGAFVFDSEYIDEQHDDERLQRLKPVTRKEAYAADITYGTNNEFGFDYLRDNMAQTIEQMAQRELSYAIVDEVDSILIDEARTPLIISAPDMESTDKYRQFSRLVVKLEENKDYNVDEKMRAATLTEAGITKMEQLLGVENIYTDRGISDVHHIEQALRAHALFKRDRDYVVREGEVIIVDEFTGRLMFGRRYSEGLHQAIEAKEGVEVQRESRTLATITFQNYFRLYKKLAGMTGTAETEAEEFDKIYGLQVTVIPTNQPMVRDDRSDRIYKNESGKFSAVVEAVKQCNEAGQPVLIGTISIERNELLAQMLQSAGIEAKVLNAKQHESEASVIAQAGRIGSVTVATNMAGRGVDIKLGGDPVDPDQERRVKELGGLFVIGTERHESRRIDNQLRGRSGRQGDPGATQFYVSMDDDLMRIFGAGRIKGMMETLKVPDDMPIENRIISRSLETAQKKVEGHNFDIRKHIVEYDDVLNKHRETIYRKRFEILSNDTLTDAILSEVREEIEEVVLVHTADENERVWDIEEIYEVVATIFSVPKDLRLKLEDIQETAGDAAEDKTARGKLIGYLFKLAVEQYQKITNEVNKALGKDDGMAHIERGILLRSIDTLWIEHLEAMGHLRTGIGLRAYGQRDPLIEYKKEAYRMFKELLAIIRKQVVYSIFKVGVATQLSPSEMQRAQAGMQFSAPSKTMSEGQSSIARSVAQIGGEQQKTAMAKEVEKRDSTPLVENEQTHFQGQKVGRNDPCPCGSGKKFKKCHGA